VDDIRKNIGESINVLDKKRAEVEQLTNEDSIKTDESLDLKNEIKEYFTLIKKLNDEKSQLETKMAEM
jgi:predicted  nucleic acid-binding Zn-ribbon protein